jgi:CheY-like chemotaxis protein
MERTQGGLGADLYVWAHRIKLAGGECGRCVTPSSNEHYSSSNKFESDIRYWFSLESSNYELNSSVNAVKDISKVGGCASTTSQVPVLTNESAYNDNNHASTSRILIVDDSAVIRKSMRQLLENMGYEIHTADDGKAALALMQEHMYEIVFMDFEMPVMGGIESTQRIREWESGSCVNKQYIVGFTASSSEEMRDMAISAGMNDFAFKPLNMELISKIIRSKKMNIV